MDIRKINCGYEYFHRCNACGSHITIYPTDCLDADYLYTEEVQNRKIFLNCPICASEFDIQTKELPDLFRSVITRKRGWKLKGKDEMVGKTNEM